MYGNVSFSSGHLLTRGPLCHRKHTIVVQSLRVGPGRDRRPEPASPGAGSAAGFYFHNLGPNDNIGVGASTLGRRRSIKISNSVGTGRVSEPVQSEVNASTTPRGCPVLTEAH